MRGFLQIAAAVFLTLTTGGTPAERGNETAFTELSSLNSATNNAWVPSYQKGFIGSLSLKPHSIYRIKSISKRREHATPALTDHKLPVGGCGVLVGVPCETDDHDSEVPLIRFAWTLDKKTGTFLRADVESMQGAGEHDVWNTGGELTVYTGEKVTRGNFEEMGPHNANAANWFVVSTSKEPARRSPIALQPTIDEGNDEPSFQIQFVSEYDGALRGAAPGHESWISSLELTPILEPLSDYYLKLSPGLTLHDIAWSLLGNDGNSAVPVRSTRSLNDPLREELEKITEASIYFNGEAAQSVVSLRDAGHDEHKSLGWCARAQLWYSALDGKAERMPVYLRLTSASADNAPTFKLKKKRMKICTDGLPTLSDRQEECRKSCHVDMDVAGESDEQVQHIQEQLSYYTPDTWRLYDPDINDPADGNSFCKQCCEVDVKETCSSRFQDETGNNGDNRNAVCEKSCKTKGVTGRSEEQLSDGGQPTTFSPAQTNFPNKLFPPEDRGTFCEKCCLHRDVHCTDSDFYTCESCREIFSKGYYVDTTPIMKKTEGEQVMSWNTEDGEEGFCKKCCQAEKKCSQVWLPNREARVCVSKCGQAFTSFIKSDSTKASTSTTEVVERSFREDYANGGNADSTFCKDCCDASASPEASSASTLELKNQDVARSIFGIDGEEFVRSQTEDFLLV
ncbi:unnamed protein product [Amoebophrya sp. A25]|nr:unnamed protein product [Amoebophrya sp. A25]|eukprot:GSA25T00004990001.1